MSLGRAHCKVAALQEAFGSDLQATYLKSILKMGEDIKEYQAQRKKLESRRYVIPSFQIVVYGGTLTDLRLCGNHA